VFARLTSTAVDPELGRAKIAVDGNLAFGFDPATGFHVWDIAFDQP